MSMFLSLILVRIIFWQHDNICLLSNLQNYIMLIMLRVKVLKEFSQCERAFLILIGIVKVFRINKLI